MCFKAFRFFGHDQGPTAVLIAVSGAPVIRNTQWYAFRVAETAGEEHPSIFAYWCAWWGVWLVFG